MVGIKETKEALIGMNEFTLLLFKHLADGFDLTDPMKVWNELKSNPVLMIKFKDAIEGYSKIPSEIADLDLSEGLELGNVQLSYVPKFVDAWKKA